MKKSIGAKTTVFPVPIYLVGTDDADGQPNIMTARVFTVSLPNSSLVAAVDFAGIVSGRLADVKIGESFIIPDGRLDMAKSIPWCTIPAAVSIIKSGPA